MSGVPCTVTFTLPRNAREACLSLQFRFLSAKLKMFIAEKCTLTPFKIIIRLLIFNNEKQCGDERRSSKISIIQHA